MITSHVDAFKVEATNAILARLGKDMYETLRYELQRQYGIELTKHTSFTLGELNAALEALLGNDSARMVINTIIAEIDRLARAEMR